MLKLRDDIERLYYSTTEAAKILNVRPSHIRYYEMILHLPVKRTKSFAKKGRRRRFTVDQINQMRTFVELAGWFNLFTVNRIYQRGKLSFFVEVMRNNLG